METSICYMVAGMSSRFNGKIKQFAKVGPNKETLIEYSMNQAIKAGFDDFIFIVGDKTEKPFKEMFGDNYEGKPIRYAKQTFDSLSRDKPWGTVDALLCAKPLINNPFVVCNGDDIYGVNAFSILNDYLRNNSSNATIGYKLGNSIPKQGSVNRGIFGVSNSKVNSVDETFNITFDKLDSMGLSLDEMCSMNIFALQPGVLDLLDGCFSDFLNDHKGSRTSECLLPTEISKLIGNGDISMSIFPTDDFCIGVTNPDDEAKVASLLLHM